MSLFHATLQTSHFTFDAYAVTERKARSLIRTGWNAHRREYGKDRVLPFAEFEDGVNCKEITVGGVYRDDDPLNPSARRGS